MIWVKSKLMIYPNKTPTYNQSGYEPLNLENELCKVNILSFIPSISLFPSPPLEGRRDLGNKVVWIYSLFIDNIIQKKCSCYKEKCWVTLGTVTVKM